MAAGYHKPAAVIKIERPANLIAASGVLPATITMEGRGARSS